MSFQRPFLLSLRRQDNRQPWGFRLNGGANYNQPLTVQKVTPGSLGERSGLREGDEMIQIGRVNVQDMTLEEVQAVLANVGSRLEVFVIREDLLRNRKENEPTTLKAVVHAQYNSPLNLYSTENIADTLAQQAHILTDGEVGYDYSSGPTSPPVVLHSKVLQVVKEEESKEHSQYPSPVSPSGSRKPPPPPPPPKPHRSSPLSPPQRHHKSPGQRPAPKQQSYYQNSADPYTHQHYNQHTSPVITQQQPSFNHHPTSPVATPKQPTYYQQSVGPPSPKITQQQPSYYPQSVAPVSPKITSQKPTFPNEVHTYGIKTAQPQYESYQHHTQQNYQQQHYQQTHYQEQQRQQPQQQQEQRIYQSEVTFQPQQKQQQVRQVVEQKTVRKVVEQPRQQTQQQTYQTTQQVYKTQQQQQQHSRPSPQSSSNQVYQTQQHQQQQQRDYQEHQQREYQLQQKQREYLQQQEQRQREYQEQQKQREYQLQQQQQREYQLQQQQQREYQQQQQQRSQQQQKQQQQQQTHQNASHTPQPVSQVYQAQNTYQKEVHKHQQPYYGSSAKTMNSSPNGSPSTQRRPIWPPKYSSVKELPKTGFSPNLVREDGTKKFIWPPPKDYVNDRSVPGSPTCAVMDAWHPTETLRTTAYASPIPSRRAKDVAWPPPHTQMEGKHKPLPRTVHRSSGRFEDYVSSNAGCGVPATYRTPPGTQHVEVIYE